jgi:hypothetical protein
MCEDEALLRNRALELAVEAMRGSASATLFDATCVVVAAEKFLAFLKGGQSAKVDPYLYEPTKVTKVTHIDPYVGEG